MRARIPSTILIPAAAAACAALAAGCGSGGQHRPHHRSRHDDPAVRHANRRPAPARARRPAPTPEAFVTAETENRLVIVDIHTGAVTRRLSLPGAPQYVDGRVNEAVASSPAAGTVSILTGPPWHVTRVLHGFSSPHIVALSPDGDHAFVTDDSRGTLSVLRFTDDRVTASVQVGAGAHHFAASPDQHEVWVALGERARTIVILDTSDIDRPVIVGRFDPGFAAHDLAFSPDGRRVWVTSASGPDVSVFSARGHRLLFRVPVGPPPQHITFLGRSVYLTSGYGSAVERVAMTSGRVIRRVAAPYGSFELAAADGVVATASLLTGQLAVFTPGLRRLRVRRLAPATRDVSVVLPLP